MRYLGGKFRIQKPLAAIINRVLLDTGRNYYEPFCGSCYVLQNIQAPKRYASDAHKELIAMWQALQGGWTPPEHVSEHAYKLAQLGSVIIPEYERGFIGFGCSFGAKWFAGYVTNNIMRNYALQSKNSVLRKVKHLTDVTFTRADFLTVAMPDDNLVIYCDPPYEGTTGYKGTPKFDHAAFWQRCRDLVSAGHIVLVSEYNVPDDFVCVWTIETKTGLRTTANGRETRIEKLFVHESQEELICQP